MQSGMQLRSRWHAAAALLAAAAATGPQGPPEPSDANSIAGALVGEPVKHQACSCDCCQVTKLGEFDGAVIADDGTKLEFLCDYPFSDSGGVNNGPTDSCPAHCDLDEEDHDLALSSAIGPQDYHRYCHFYCKPSFYGLGNRCQHLSRLQMHKVGNEKSGNGHTMHYGPAPGLARAQQFKEQGEGVIQAPALAAKQVAAAASLDRQVVYDMRNLISQRLRAEAGAHMARGSAAASHVVADEVGTKRNMVLTRMVNKALRGVDQKIFTDLDDTRSEAVDATEAAEGARAAFREMKAEYQDIMMSTEKLAVEEIKKQTRAAARREAQAQVILQSWDKPPNWGRVLAARASDPYMREMVNAITRTSEYGAYANGVSSQAKGAQARAAGLAGQANAMQAHGDKLGAAAERDEVRALMARAKSLDAEAHKFWNVADATRSSVSEWQMAGTQAAAHVAWEYELAVTPEGSVHRRRTTSPA